MHYNAHGTVRPVQEASTDPSPSPMSEYLVSRVSIENYRARNDTLSPLYMSYVRQGMMLQCDLLRVYSDLCKVVINARPPLARVCIFMPS